MMVSELYAKRGDLILPKWQALLKFLKECEIVRGPKVRITQGPNGTLVRAESDAASWAHPWQCVPAFDGAGKPCVRFAVPGTLNTSIIPTIDGAPIDGMQPDGTEGQPPALPVVPRESGTSYVALAVKVDADGQLVRKDGKPQAECVELPALDARSMAGGYPDKGGQGFQPLACIYWRGGQITRIRPVAHHNLQHRFIWASDNRPARHLFWAV